MDNFATQSKLKQNKRIDLAALRLFYGLHKRLLLKKDCSSDILILGTKDKGGQDNENSNQDREVLRRV